jgi:hypothetical protein
MTWGYRRNPRHRSWRTNKSRQNETMAILSAKEHVALLKRAELQFRLMIAVRTASTLGKLPLQVPVLFIFGRQSATSADLALTQDEADEGAAILEHTTTYTLALQIHQAMKDVLVKPRVHTNQEVRHAFEIASLIRHAYAHQPFNPHWLVDRACRAKTFEVSGIARADTTTLQGQPVRWQDYGGPLALFRLSQYVRSVILPAEPVDVRRTCDSDSPITAPPTEPGDVVQQGRVLLVTLSQIPDGYEPVRVEDAIVPQCHSCVPRI